MMIKENKTHQYLKTLTKNELIDIILKFASANFINNINGQFYNKEKSLISFEKALDEIESIFSNDDLLYNPNQFEKELINALEKVKWAWDKLPTDMGDLIVSIIEDIEQSFEDGYLYIENYTKGDEYFESEYINNYAFEFVNSLPTKIKSNYIEKLKDVLADSGYSTFNSLESRL